MSPVMFSAFNICGFPVDPPHPRGSAIGQRHGELCVLDEVNTPRNISPWFCFSFLGGGTDDGGGGL